MGTVMVGGFNIPEQVGGEGTILGKVEITADHAVELAKFGFVEVVFCHYDIGLRGCVPRKVVSPMNSFSASARLKMTSAAV